jgi:hypothetical protein
MSTNIYLDGGKWFAENCEKNHAFVCSHKKWDTHRAGSGSTNVTTSECTDIDSNCDASIRMLKQFYNFESETPGKIQCDDLTHIVPSKFK